MKQYVKEQLNLTTTSGRPFYIKPYVKFHLIVNRGKVRNSYAVHIQRDGGRYSAFKISRATYLKIERSLVNEI